MVWALCCYLVLVSNCYEMTSTYQIKFNPYQTVLQRLLRDTNMILVHTKAIKKERIIKLLHCHGYSAYTSLSVLRLLYLLCYLFFLLIISEPIKTKRQTQHIHNSITITSKSIANPKLKQIEEKDERRAEHLENHSLISKQIFTNGMKNIQYGIKSQKHTTYKLTNERL